MCVSVCECVCVWMLCLQSIYSFPQVQFMSGMWGINRNCICGYLLGGGYSISCTRVCVCCRRVNVHQSIQPCLQSLILVIYSEAEQGHAFETAPGEQIKGKGSSPSSWKISTPGTVTRTHSPDTILIRVHTHSRRLGWEASSFHLLKCLFLLFSQSGQPPDTVTSICGSLSACVPLHSITWATGPCNTSVLEDRFFFFSSPTSQSCLQHKQESQLGVWHDNRGVEVEA